MGIEINSNSGNINSGSHLQADDSKSGQASKNVTNDKVMTGRPVETIQMSENAKALESVSKTISTLPVVDPNKVEKAANAIKNRDMAILSKSQEERLKSAERIASRILGLEEELTTKK